MLQDYLDTIRRKPLVHGSGSITRSYGLLMESNGPPVFVGESCTIYSQPNEAPVTAEVVGIQQGRVMLMPFGDVRGVRVGSRVVASGQAVNIPVGEMFLGRVVDAFGNALDGKPAVVPARYYPLYAPPINPMSRAPIEKVLHTGIKVIDTLLTLGRGQRMGIFAGSGVGKSTLLGMIARNMDADVNVIALIGERGREVLDFVQQTLGAQGLRRSVVVVATSDQPALVRTHAAFAATAMAEYFRDRGRDVMLTMDSVTRFAMAQREIGLAVGEPPTARGYTPSVFALLPKLLERGGNHGRQGSITALYTVLVEGDDLHDPVADSIRAILDGHIVLSRDLANEAHFPSVDVLQSISRLAHGLHTVRERTLSQKAHKILSVYKRSKDMIDVGAYRAGANAELDRAMEIHPRLLEFMQQDTHKKSNAHDAWRQLELAMESRKPA